eukprot:7812931-Pyramimonas_sp.AAC.1
MAYECCLPYIRSITPVVDTPWAHRIGLELRLRGTGEQLLCRSLLVAPRLPQVPRPSAAPTAGSKSSAKKLEQAERAQKKKERLISE